MTTNTANDREHTPGPWEAVGLSVYHQKDKPLALVDTNYLSDCSTDPDRSERSVISEHEAEANARLIAAAPELLDAVKSMYLFISTYGGEVTKNFAGTNNENLKHYSDLIAKAEGR